MLKQNIEEVLLNFTQKIKDPIAVKEIDLKRANPNNNTPQIIWNDLSLASGYPGILILCTLLEKKGYLTEGTAHLYVLEIKNALENQGTYSLSLFSGFAGLCFAIDEASFGRTRYSSLLQTLQSYLLSHVDEHILDPLRANIKKAQPSSSFLYDLISGVCGIGRYALENLNSPSFVELSEQITKILIQLSLPITIESKRIPGWYLLPTDVLNQDKFKTHPNGNFNLGLAHGVTGILSYLAIAYLKGIKLEGQEEAIERLSLWIKSKSFSHQGGVNWPYAVSLEEELEGKQMDYKIVKAGWCYGVPGIARSLYFAGKALKDGELKSFAMHSMIQLLSKPPEAWRLPGPCLCHGMAGLVAVTEAMSQEEEGKELQPKVMELKHLLMNHYEPDSIWGFRDVESKIDQNGDHYFDKVHKIDFLEGATGIFLTLLPEKEKTSKWHLPLMIYE